MSELGRNIVRIRGERGMTLRGLGAEIDLSAQYLCDIEQDRRYPPFRTIEKIANALGVGVLDLDPEVMVSVPYRLAAEHGIVVKG